MADDAHMIRGINWRQTFPFTNIFRAFRVAIHPSKLLLGLLLLLSLYLTGRVLDAVWPVRHLAIEGSPGAAEAGAGAGEVDRYQEVAYGPANHAAFNDWRDQQLRAGDATWSQWLQTYKLAANAREADDLAYGRKKGSEIKQKLLEERDARIKEARDAYAKEDAATDNIVDANQKARAKKDAVRTRDAAITAAEVETGERIKDVNRLRGQGLFAAFFKYEVEQVTHVAAGVLANDWTGPAGVVRSVLNFFTVGPVWLLWHHTVYFILFAVIFLVVWSLFGGAIARIAAVHVARDEKISIRQALNFAVGKFLSFASAPVIPLLIILVIGLVVAVASLLGIIPWIGPVLIGAAFALALLAGFVMTLVLLGTAGGFNLMYPTVAVEGSDSFDAISRSFSYVYARPWRMLFYTVVAVIYGAATYLFIHLFIYLLLSLTHTFVGLGWQTHVAGGRQAFDVIWPNPADHPSLTYDVDYSSLNNGGEKVAAVLIQFWVMLLVAFLGAFAISFYFSANTIIYYLMRNEVDATELDDVYLEQSDEDFGDTVATTPAPGAPDAPPSPAAPEAPATPAGPKGTGGVVIIPDQPGSDAAPAT